MISLIVYGLPAPQGSKHGFAIKKGGTYTGKVSMQESSKKVKPWRQDVKAAAEAAIGSAPALDGPLVMNVVFTFARPKGHFGSGKNAHQLRQSAPPFPSTYPDLSKLIRSTEDALSDAGVWADDARVVTVVAEKRYVGDPLALDRPGARIYIEAKSS